MKKVTLCFFFLSIGFFFKSSAQRPNATIDAQHYTFALQLNDQNDIIKGQATITAKFLKNVSFFQLDLVKKTSTGKGMVVSQVKENGKPVSFTQSDGTVKISAAAKKNTTHSFTIAYAGIPAD